MSVEALKFRNREFIDNELKEWHQINTCIAREDNIEFAWIPDGQSESSWTEMLEIKSVYVNPIELSQHTAIETRGAFLAAVGDSVEHFNIEESDSEVIFEVIFPPESAGEPTVYSLIRMVHDENSIKNIMYSKITLKEDDIDRVTWLKNIKKLDVALSRPSPKMNKINKDDP